MKPNKKTAVYGVTGGIGAGKSRVLSYIGRRYEARIIRADEVGRRLMEPGRPVFDALVNAYGQKILNPEGEIDKQKVASIGFQSREAQEALNKLEHGIIREEIEKQIRRTRKPVVFLEAALLVEGGLKPLCKKTVYIHAPEDVRIGRLKKSRGYSEEKCRKILSLQLNEETFRAHADLVIENGGDFRKTAEEITRLMKKLSVPERSHR